MLKELKAMRTCLLFSLFILLVPIQLWAQQPIYRTYDGRHGLPSSEVYDVLQDSNGFIWFTTDHGLARFDGYQFKTFDLQDGMPESSVFYMFPAADSAIWFTSLSGKLGFIQNELPSSFAHNDSIMHLLSQVHSRLFPNGFHVDKKGNIYFSTTRSGIFKVEASGSITKICDTEPHALMLLELEEKALLGTFSEMESVDKIIYENKNGKQVFPLEESLHIKTGQLFLETKVANNKLYISTQDRLMSIHESQLQTIRVDGVIITFDFDKEGNLWVGTLSNGIYVFNESLKLLEHYFPDKTITGFLEDHEGGIWLTTLTEGIIYIPYKNFLFLSNHDGLPSERIIDLEIDPQSRVWWATINGYFGYLQNQQLQKKNKLNIQDDVSTMNILYDTVLDRILISTNFEFFESTSDGKNYNLVRSTSSQFKYNHDATIQKMIQRKGSGNIWRGHFSGISILNQQNEITYTSWENNQFTKRVECMVERNENEVWIGTTSGLYQYNKGRYIFYGDYFPVLNQRITTLLDLGDTLWVGTRGNGLYCFADRKLIQFSVKDGLISNDVNHIKATNEHLFIGTNRGLSIMRRKLNQNKAFISNLVAGSGIAGNEVTAMALQNSSLYIATPEGISIINTEDYDQTQSIPIHITSVQVADQKVDVSLHKKINYSSNQLVINYFAISYRISGKQTYRHRLLGLDNNWIINQQTTSQYPFLPPGKYTFEVQVLNPSGIWGPLAATYSFEILRPIWMKWWFILISGFLSILLLVLIVRYFFHQLNRRKQLETELNLYRQEALKNQMNPHFLFNALNTVQRYILENDKVSSSKYLTKFSGLMRTILNNSQEHLISIESEINALKLYLELEAARFKDTFSFQIICRPEIDSKTTLVPVFLVQPLVENSLRHGLRDINYYGNLTVEYLKTKNDLIIRVTDNGIGRDAAAAKKSSYEKKSLGISIIQKRLSLIGKNTKNNNELIYKDLRDENGNPCGTIAEIIMHNYFISKRNE